jgi:hypothetical protein
VRVEAELVRDPMDDGAWEEAVERRSGLERAP